MKTFMTARWENLIMANYTIDPAALLGYLPPGVEIDLFEGKAYVSLVGFLFKNSQIFGVPIPLLGTFEEVNLRFYVRRRDGHGYKRGVVFINETVPYKPVAWLANKLAPHGERLDAGEIVLGGSFTRPVACAAGDVFHADYGPLGSISVRFV